MRSTVYLIGFAISLVLPALACGGSAAINQFGDEPYPAANVVEHPAQEEPPADLALPQRSTDTASPGTTAVIYTPDNNPCPRPVWTFLASGGGGGGLPALLYPSGQDYGAILNTFPHANLAEVAFADSHGDMIMTHAFQEDIRLWDASSGFEKWHLERESGLRYPALSRQNSLLAAASGGGKVWLWDLADPEGDKGILVADFELDPHDILPITALALSPDGSLLAIGRNVEFSRDFWLRRWGVIHVLDLQSGQELARLEGQIIQEEGRQDNGDPIAAVMANGHAAPINWLAFSPDSAALFSGSTIGALAPDDEGADGTIRIWDLATGEHLRCLETAIHGPATAISISPDGRQVATASGSAALIWDTSTSQVSRRFELPQQLRLGVDFVRFSPDGALIATMTKEEQAVRLCDAQNGSLQALLRHPAEVRAFDFSPDSRQLLTGIINWDWEDPNGEAWLWDADHESLRLAAAAQLLVDESLTRGQAGDIEGMFGALQEAANLLPDDELLWRPAVMRTLCQLGILAGRTSDVWDLCQYALQQALAAGMIPYELVDYYDTDAIARAVLGDHQGAIADLQVYPDINSDRTSAEQRRYWIELLAAGSNPFDQATLQALWLE